MTYGCWSMHWRSLLEEHSYNGDFSTQGIVYLSRCSRLAFLNKPPEPCAAHAAAVGPHQKYHQEVSEDFASRRASIGARTVRTDLASRSQRLHRDSLCKVRHWTHGRVYEERCWWPALQVERSLLVFPSIIHNTIFGRVRRREYPCALYMLAAIARPFCCVSAD
jgi:hypothetical protein